MYKKGVDPLVVEQTKTILALIKDDILCETDSVKLQIQKVHSEAVDPEFAHPDEDACFDLFAVEEVVIAPGEREEVHSGWKMAVPQGWEILVRTRSGMGFKKGLRAHPGTVDSGFRGEISAMVYNLSNEEQVIEKGQGFCQVAVRRVPRVVIEEVEELPESKRGEDGFGSSDDAEEIV
jgi:dUTP pyrophosphatase